MRNLIVLLCLLSFGWAKDMKQVQVMATHAFTHDARDTNAKIDKFFNGASSLGRQVESFNLDTVIDEEHVLLTCIDDKGCESPKLGTYSGELKGRGRYIRLTFDLPLNHGKVTRSYKVAGSW